MQDWQPLCSKLTGLSEYRFSKAGILEWRDSPHKEWREFTLLDRRTFMQVLNVRDWTLIQQSIVWLAEQRRQLR